MNNRETISFYFRLIFLPLLLLSTLLRAWGSSWSSLEAVHSYHDRAFQRMWNLLPVNIQEQVETDKEDCIEQNDIRRFARMLGEYTKVRPNFSVARSLNSKYQYQNNLDAAQRRLRIAQSREAEAVRWFSKSPR